MLIHQLVPDGDNGCGGRGGGGGGRGGGGGGAAATPGESGRHAFARGEESEIQKFSIFLNFFISSTGPNDSL